ncbi:MAG: peptidoglycan-associated lipoprotein Pal [Sphingomonadales bacterium]
MQSNGTFMKFLMASTLTLFLAACGGGEEIDTTPTEPAPTTAPPPPPIDTGPVYADGSQEQLAALIGDVVLFAYDSDELTSASRATLRAQAGWMGTYSNVSITIEGHADERGTREYNLALGERRAVAVQNYLEGLGVDASRISRISYGKERPVSFCSNESCWSQNRRGATVVN